jgi:cation diffusion facilitator CzcD-associated flavoprotein CzcO
MAESIGQSEDLEVLVVGAGFSGMHILHELVKRNYKVRLVDAGDGPGGTWDSNRYPGARVDSEAWVYQYTDPDLWKKYYFAEKFPDWKALKDYFSFVADEWNIRPFMTFQTRVKSAKYDTAEDKWDVLTNSGELITARYLVLALGSTTKPVAPYFPGVESFEGGSFHTARWPHEGVNFKGKRVAVIGTGASGVQVIQEASHDAAHLTVFQRTPNLALPMGQEKYTRQEYEKLKPLFEPALKNSRETYGGFAYDLIHTPWKDIGEAARQQLLHDNWNTKGFRFWLGAPMDLFFDEDCNRAHYYYWRDETRKLIKKDHLIELLAPTEPPHPFGTKRPCLQQCYFDAFNQPNVDLIDVNANPIERITQKGIVAGGKEHPFDIIVYAIGFDTATGALSDIDIQGTDGRPLSDLWKERSISFLGKAVPGYPNMLYTYALQSPTAFLNGPTAAELEGDWVVRVLDDMKSKNVTRLEAKWEAAEAWAEHCFDLGAKSLFPKAKSWYMAANGPGKRPEIQPFIGGQPAYRKALYDETDTDYSNFILS